MHRNIIVAAALFGIAAVSTNAAPQSSQGQIAVGAGSATDERGVRAEALTLAPSLLLAPGSNTSVVLGANAVRFANSAWQFGGSAGLSTRSPAAGGFAVAFNASGSAARASFDATFAQADATPALQWSAGPVTLIGGAHLASGYTAVSTRSAAPLIQPATQLVSQSRSEFAPSYGGELRLGAGTASTVVLSYREESARVSGVPVTDRVAGGTLSLGAFAVTAMAGHRDAPDERLDFASGSASLPLSSMLSLTMAGGTYPSNRLTGAAGGRFFSTGLSVRLGGYRAPSAPQPSGVGAPLPERTRLAIRAGNATRVEVAGDWDSWMLAPAQRAGNGVWYVDLALKPGEYRYAFRVDGTEWRVPEGVVTVDDGFGSKAAYVTVRAADSTLVKHTQEER